MKIVTIEGDDKWIKSCSWLVGLSGKRSDGARLVKAPAGKADRGWGSSGNRTTLCPMLTGEVVIRTLGRSETTRSHAVGFTSYFVLLAVAGV